MSPATQFPTLNDANGRGRYAWLPPPAAKIGLWFFMGVVTTLFFLLTIAFLARSQTGGWRSLADPGQPLWNSWRLWVNTSMLLASSIMLEIASRTARRGNLVGTRIGLGLAGLFAVGFLFGQLSFWQVLVEQGYFLSSNPANSFFYLITGLHGLHLTGGLVAWARVSARAWRGVAVERQRLGVELTSRYWHFLLLIWLAMFALLSSSDGTIAALAKLCGMR